MSFSVFLFDTAGETHTVPRNADCIGDKGGKPFLGGEHGDVIDPQRAMAENAFDFDAGPGDGGFKLGIAGTAPANIHGVCIHDICIQ